MASLLLLPACRQATPTADSTLTPQTQETSADSKPWFAQSQTNEQVSSGGTTQSPPNVTATQSRAGTHAAQPTQAPPRSGTAAQTGSVENISKTVMVTIPEGYTFYQVAALLETKGVCSVKAFFDAAQGYEVKSFNIKNDPDRCYKMEGYLFPDSYEFYRNANPTDVLIKILNNYYQKSGLPGDDTLILASLIEHEARSAEHRAKVSAVFHNRLAKGMRLEADCTIFYVEKHIKPNPLVSDPGRFAALYNTYKCAALPAGPICNPSRSAINAAKNPAAGMEDYYYYFFGNDNTNHYSKTYEEHQAQMKQYGVQYN